MIIVRDTKPRERMCAPPWMEGAADLQSREDGDGRLWGIGDGRLIGPPASEKAWRDIGDDYQGRLIQPFVPALLMRRPFWCPFETVTDQQGREWMAPRILAGDTLLIQVTYGPGWVPELTPAQAITERVARWARQTATQPVETAKAAEACADLMAAVMHVSPGLIAGLRLLDEGLLLAFLRTAKGG